MCKEVLVENVIENISNTTISVKRGVRPRRPLEKNDSSLGCSGSADRSSSNYAIISLRPRDEASRLTTSFLLFPVHVLSFKICGC
jgi:hypothetical protein